MDNPYTPPEGRPDAVPKQLDSHRDKILRGLTAAGAILAVVAFAGIGVILLMQAWRFSSEVPRLPPRAQPGHAAIALSSAVTGGLAVMGVVLNLVALNFLRRGQTRLPLIMLGVSLVVVVAAAIFLKPG